MKNNPNQTSKDAWNANAEIWDSRMGDDGNDFFNDLCWPVLASFLNPKPDSNILDIACGNGLASRRLAAFGANVTAFDFSENLIEKAKARSNPDGRISYHIVDATDESTLLALGEKKFDSALSNMALFDMANIETLFQTLPRLLKTNGIVAFSIMHPCFNNSSSIRLAEEWDNGRINTRYAVKISRYMTPYHTEGLAFRNQDKPHLYFERPIQYYMNIGFQNGFIVDGFEERAFPPNHPHSNPLSWGGKFSEIPLVLVMRMRLK